LINYVNGQNLPAGIKNGIIGPLHQSVSILTDNNPNNDVAVCNKLDAFVAQVDLK
jgi:hypothetical protein